MLFFSALFCAYMTSAISNLMSAVSKKLSFQVKFDKRHLKNQICFNYYVSWFPLLGDPISVCITCLHLAFLPVDSHLPLHILWDPCHLQPVPVCGLQPGGKPALPETMIKGLRGSSAGQQPRRRPAETQWRATCPTGYGRRLQWFCMILDESFVLHMLIFEWQEI